MKMSSLIPVQLKEALTFQVQQRLSDGGGGADVTWVDQFVLHAAIKQMSGFENFQSDQLNARRRLQITLRYHLDIVPEGRFVWNGRVLDILSVDNVENRNVWIVCICEEEQV